ncbi:MULTISPECIES: hypothetical protein [Weissella]|uniref:hypothetical protein n=1 Tax=Weissella TaxID=46255 RepID=UPI0002191997|nr:MULTISPECIES: hypothetical protein [Weissella]APS27867.1 hypothetical protein AUC63_01871 [Weissella cibaria]APU63266.1 hypothetical protein AUC65_01478 [Weissella cibaria]APU65416.1 hypothetical protein AUC62_01470 [Weissella cibaria]ASS51207.1 hypothetical protein CHR48_00213 [Weissella cibaria]MBA5963106.1 hypothetical protein [Weissella cibaria]
MKNKTVKVENVHVEGLDELKKLSQDLLEQAEQLSNTIERFNQLKLIISTRNDRFIPEDNDGIKCGNPVSKNF